MNIFFLILIYKTYKKYLNISEQKDGLKTRYDNQNTYL